LPTSIDSSLACRLHPQTFFFFPQSTPASRKSSQSSDSSIADFSTKQAPEVLFFSRLSRLSTSKYYPFPQLFPSRFHRLLIGQSKDPSITI
jgi:hypothetical protein